MYGREEVKRGRVEKVKPQLPPYEGRDGNILLSCLGQRFMIFPMQFGGVIHREKSLAVEISDKS